MRPLFVALIVMLFSAAGASALRAQTTPETPATADSAKKSTSIAAEQLRLRGDLETLKAQVYDLRKTLDTASTGQNPDTERNIRKLERRMHRLEDRMTMLDERLRSGDSTTTDDVFASGFDDDADDDWGFEEEWQNFDIEPEDEQFAIRPDFYKKYPGSFTGLFPIDSRMQEGVFRYNRVEGVYIGVAQPKRQYWHSKPRMVGTGSLGYAFANHRWRYSLGAYLPFYFDDMILEIGGEGHSFTDSKDQWLINREENTAMAFFAREDFMDYFSREGFSATAGWYYKGPSSVNLRGTVGYVHDTYESMDHATDWSVFGGDKVFRPQGRINDGNLNSLVFTAGANNTPTASSSLRGWDAQLSIEKAGAFMKGDFDFTQMILDIRRYQPIDDYLSLNLRFRAGASDGTLPVQRSMDLGGVSTLPGYRYKEFSGTHAALVNAEFILRAAMIDDTRGWVASALSFFNIILFTDAGVTNTPQRVYSYGPDHGTLIANFNDGFNELSSQSWKSDAGIAIGSAEGDFRIGMAWRLDHPSKANFVLRFSRPF